MIDPQRIVDAMSDVARDTRADYHLTLGGIIKALSDLPAHTPVSFDWNGLAPNREMSYRGYYSDLSFDYRKECSVEDFLKVCRQALNRTYEGYKGGDYLMNDKTPLWAACYGDTGRAILGIDLMDSAALLITKDLH